MRGFVRRATYDSVAFRFIAANQHPDHDTIASFRRRFLKQIEALFVQVLVMAREMGKAGQRFRQA
jgi:transposase